MIWRFTVWGAPRTKKNHGRLVRAGNRPRLLPSKPWEFWKDNAAITPAAKSIKAQVNCKAVFYRDRASGDAVGYYQGLADLLEKRGVIVNDRQIVSWDGSRLEKDKALPRVEVELTEAA